MIVKENQCVDCGFPCIGTACRYKDVSVCYCDGCEDELAEYEFDGEHWCEDCLKSYLLSAFKDMTVLEQAEALNLDIKEVYI